MPETRLCPYRERGLECRTARADGHCRCYGPPESHEALSYVLGMLTLADSYLLDLRPDAAQQALRDGIRALRAELGTDVAPETLQAYRERVAAQGRAIDTHLNEGSRKRRKGGKGRKMR